MHQKQLNKAISQARGPPRVGSAAAAVPAAAGPPPLPSRRQQLVGQLLPGQSGNKERGIGSVEVCRRATAAEGGEVPRQSMHGRAGSLAADLTLARRKLAPCLPGFT